MSRLWKVIKDHPYVSTAVVFGSVGAYIYWDQQKRQREVEERIRRNRQDSENRDRARREAAAAAAASSSQKPADVSSVTEPSTPCPPIPRIPSLSRTEFEQWTSTIAPVFKSESVVECQFEEFDLAAHEGRWVVLLFMPLELVSSGVSMPNSAGIELLVQLQEKKHAFETKHIDIVVVSPESKHYLKKMSESPHSEGGLGGVSFPLVSDLNSVASSLYGIPSNPNTERDSSQAVMYILAPQMVIQDRETYRASKPPTVEHILSRLSALQQKDSS